jgi:hypothetical protein
MAFFVFMPCHALGGGIQGHQESPVYLRFDIYPLDHQAGTLENSIQHTAHPHCTITWVSGPMYGMVEDVLQRDCPLPQLALDSGIQNMGCSGLLLCEVFPLYQSLVFLNFPTSLSFLLLVPSTAFLNACLSL